ncbi:hypothetical protein L198_01613 [Cryptococcus wingfieldii CBS 7118]|uniref:Uncharacterized protein n=1 Tax=Cryptococcus wingfieldii CBS 7118 TaxID=1295528 RepID=A0A1E3K030_9TREE|nr:hypothetical protein L198_01613 [Cryptococcus wingfieldii CBS 7118]ODO06381.1 hypothetical protein L198_01613 [Cryptococcus wingfieldii CBS 7118]
MCTAFLRTLPRTIPRAARNIHSTPRLLASEIPTSPFEDPIFKAFADRVKQHQGAVDAMKSVMNVMQAKGFDKNKKPTIMQMMQMASDTELKAAASTLMTELQKAGVGMDEAREIFSRAQAGTPRS